MTSTSQLEKDIVETIRQCAQRCLRISKHDIARMYGDTAWTAMDRLKGRRKIIQSPIDGSLKLVAQR